MKKIILFLLVMICSWNIASADENKKTAKEIAQKMPDLGNVSCTFSQQRTVSDMVFTSGGNFKFIENKGVIFETTYPVKMTSSYNTAQNKQINDIILAVSNKNYTYLEKNFKLGFTTQKDKWQLVLEPKNDNIKSHLNNVTINGHSGIERMIINTVKNGITDISFNCGS